MIDNDKIDKKNCNEKKKYNGSNICVLSSHLFLLASLFNYYQNNIIESISIFILYITSIIYHYNGEKTVNINAINNNIKVNYRIIDVYCCRIVIVICILLSLINYNIYPTLATLFISIMYFYEIAYTNILHSMLIHLPGALGFFSIYNNNIFLFKNITSQIFTIWIFLLLICVLYLIYYEFYLSYKLQCVKNEYKQITKLKDLI